MKNIFKKLSLQLSLGALSAFMAICMAAFVVSGCSDSSKNGDTYSQIVVFGASLSDNGNAATVVPGLFPGAPYYPGRASNGLLWIDLVADEFGNEVKPFVNGGSNYAVGGARTCAISGTSVNPFDMCYQTDIYLTQVRNKADASALYVVDAATVGNNIFAVINNGLPGSVITTEAASDIAKIMDKLYKTGARKFLVTNVPDVGATPRGQGLPSPATATALGDGFNATLNNELANFRASHSGTDVRLADFKAAVAIKTGFTNTTDPCVVNLIACATPDTYTYWDNLHPTAATGRNMAKAALAVLK
jgi:phospholipase/lecithinase/hemolysin